MNCPLCNTPLRTLAPGFHICPNAIREMAPAPSGRAGMFVMALPTMAELGYNPHELYKDNGIYTDAELAGLVRTETRMVQSA